MMDPLRNNLQATLGDAYTLERELGGGGMSRVFVAHETALGRDVVVKVLAPELAAALSAERFAREIKLAAALQEPHIVPVLSAGLTTDGLPYYTMPFVRGDTLRTRMQTGRIAPHEALGMLRNVALALAYAHERGIVHRDIKPENVLLSSGTAVVTDFGIAKALSASASPATGNTLTSVGSAIGTPAYMAPEQAVGDPDTDHRADLYAWGVMAYELLGGRHPFAERTTPHALIAAHMSETPRALREINGELSEPFANLVMRCLAKEPNGRPKSAHELLAALDAAGAATTSHERVSSTDVGTKPAASRSTMRWATLGAALITTLAIGYVVTRDSGAEASVTAQSVAVLPFADLSADGQSSYLGDGVAETLINALSKVPGLTVSARTSSFAMRNREDDLQAVAQQLGVTAVLTGSIQRSGDRLRVSARAIRIANDSILWSEIFDRPANDIFAVQDEVAQAVTTALQLRFASNSNATQDVGGTSNAEAYDAYLLGRYYWNLRTTNGMVEATAAFKKAIAADSMFARAWSGLADAYSLSTPNEYSVPGVTSDSILPLAEAAANRAIALAPSLGEAYASLGQAVEGQQRYDEALSAYERAITLSPEYATGHQWYAYTLMSLGRFDDGVREMELAHKIDPLAHVITLSLAIAYDAVDRFADATPLYAQGLTQSPEAWYGWYGLVGHELALGRLDAAAAAMLRTVDDGSVPNRDAYRALVLRWQDPTTREQATDALILSGPPILSLQLARWQRDDDAVLNLLERVASSDQENPFGAWAAYALVGPQGRNNPRFRPVFRALGFPELPGVRRGVD